MTPNRRSVMLAATALVLIIIIAGGVAAGAFLRGRGDSAHFFVLPTPHTCGLEINVTDAHFAAHLDSAVPAVPGDKFAVVGLAVTNAGIDDAPLDVARFSLAAKPGQSSLPVTIDGAGMKLPTTVAAGTGAAGSLVFSLPAATGAAKLVYDDGCAHQEWLVP